MLRWWIRLQHVLLLCWSTFCWSAVILSFCAFWECVGSQLAAIKGCAPGPVRAIPECIAIRCVTTWLTLVVLPSSSFPLIRLQCGEICQSDTRMRTHTYTHAHTHTSRLHKRVVACGETEGQSTLHISTQPPTFETWGCVEFTAAQQRPLWP